MRVPTSSTASVASSSQPIHDPRPVATISTSSVESAGSRSKLPRFLRSQTQWGVTARLRRIAPWVLT